MNYIQFVNRKKYTDLNVKYDIQIIGNLCNILNNTSISDTTLYHNN